MQGACLRVYIKRSNGICCKCIRNHRGSCSLPFSAPSRICCHSLLLHLQLSLPLLRQRCPLLPAAQPPLAAGIAGDSHRSDDNASNLQRDQRVGRGKGWWGEDLGRAPAS